MNLQTTWAIALRYLSEPSSQTGFPPTMMFPSRSFFPPTSFICSGKKTEMHVDTTQLPLLYLKCFLDAQASPAPTPIHPYYVSSSVILSDFHSVSVTEPSQRVEMTDMEVDMVADMEVDKVANMEVNMVADSLFYPATIGSGATWWPNLQIMQMVPPGGQICN